MRVLFGVAAATAASLLYDVGVACQAHEARRTSTRSAMRVSLLATLARRPIWLAGLALGIVGWPLQAVATRLAPLSVVQPTLGVGLIALLAIGAHRMAEPVRQRDVLAVCGLLAGVALLTIGGGPAGTAHLGTAAATMLAITAMATLAPVVAAAVGIIDGRLATVGAGIGFAWSGISTKLCADSAAAGRWPAALGWAVATAAASGVALLSESTALQRRPVTRTAPAVFALQVLVPLAVMPWIGVPRWAASPVAALATIVGVAAVLGAATDMLHSRAVDAATAPS
ncbi:hypothetical protein [Capillimicrobium parvum]|uniref:DMT family transporter n=1 Tax=Capillimicrobium parvum TaxID=2884022 RepID=A0A9E7C092_9ACTN|nr:hypothetical protein [Capillimicrobium parvum]UGS36136.1 hypothetical protein DSM104329_02536 [Capillimicrobium parvum]